MPDAWNHPKLGRFTYDGLGWVTTIRVPAFNVFRHDTGYGNARKPNGKYELSFAAWDEDDLPSAEQVDVALRVLADPKGLASKVVDALWEDFNGRGPRSGMWWHGGLDQIAETLEDAGLAPPQKATDILPHLRLYSIRVRPDTGWRDGKPSAELDFHAPFEDEHGVALLTDGDSILGTGFVADVQPFKKSKAPKTPKKSKASTASKGPKKPKVPKKRKK
jgi:hypothetical protein